MSIELLVFLYVFANVCIMRLYLCMHVYTETNAYLCESVELEAEILEFPNLRGHVQSMRSGLNGP